MKNQTKIVIAFIALAVLLISVAYATINAINLSISGTATATADQSNFKVEFFGTPEPSDTSKVEAGIDAVDKKIATITVSNLNAKGDTATAIYQVKNYSADLTASLEAEILKNTNTGYFKIEPILGAATIGAGNDTTLTIKVTLEKTPVEGDQTSEIKVQLKASPVQTPGE